MVDRKYKIIELDNGKKDIVILVENVKNSELLTSFLHSDVKVFDDWIKNCFDKVISGQSERETISGNICFVEINLTKTKIYDFFVDDEDTYCEMDTKELRLLIDEWCDKVKGIRELYGEKRLY